MNVRRNVSIILALMVACLLAGCGSEDPHPGNLTVESDPEGAAITLDGVETDQVTPHTFADLGGGTSYTVQVTLDGYTAFPAERTVEVPYGSTALASFTLSQGAGSLAVTSTPAGAAIFLDGTDTGEMTPHTFDALIPGSYVVTVELANHVSQPAEFPVTITDGANETADFTLVVENVPRIVLLEGFSNTFCIGCPPMNANVDFVMHADGYDRDRLLYVKWPAFLSPLDPFYWVTQTITNARVDWYYGSTAVDLPTLSGDGALLGGHGTPPNADGIEYFVDGQPEFADVMVTVTCGEDLGDVTDLTHEATITLNAPGGLDLSDYHLNVVLVYEEVTTEYEYPHGNGDEFHWVMRDHVQPSLDVGELAAGTDYTFDVTLNDPYGGEHNGHDVYPEHKQIIAWLQHGTSRAVIQAGSTAVTQPTPVAPLTGSDDPDVQNGGS